MPLALIVVRSYRVSGDPVLAMSDGGMVFYLAKTRLDQGFSCIPPRSEALFALGKLDPMPRARSCRPLMRCPRGDTLAVVCRPSAIPGPIAPSPLAVRGTRCGEG